MSTYAVINIATNICDNVIAMGDSLGEWTPPAGHYAVNIDGLSVGIGYYYDPATQVWSEPPTITASFSPSPIFLTQTTTLAWDAIDATSVTLDGEPVASSGTKDYTPTAIGTQSVLLIATGLAGTAKASASVRVVSTQAELDSPYAPTVL